MRIAASRPIHSLTKHLWLFGAFFKANLISSFEFRLNFLLTIFIDVIWYGVQIAQFAIIHTHFPQIGDWDINETRVFLGVIFVVDALFVIFLYPSLEILTDRVVKGDLDFLLAKPVSSQFLVSFERMNIATIANLFMGIGWLIWSLQGLPQVTWLQVLWFLALIPSALMIGYTFRFVLAATSVIFVRADNLQFLWWSIHRFGMRPDSIYKRSLRLVLMTVLPVVLIFSVPTRALLDQASLSLLLWTLFLGPFFLFLSMKYWHFCLRRYSSASS